MKEVPMPELRDYVKEKNAVSLRYDEEYKSFVFIGDDGEEFVGLHASIKNKNEQTGKRVYRITVDGFTEPEPKITCMEEKLYVIRKYVMAKNLNDVIKKEKDVNVFEAWIDDDWKKENTIIIKGFQESKTKKKKNQK